MQGIYRCTVKTSGGEVGPGINVNGVGKYRLVVCDIVVGIHVYFRFAVVQKRLICIDGIAGEQGRNHQQRQIYLAKVPSGRAEDSFPVAPDTEKGQRAEPTQQKEPEKPVVQNGPQKPDVAKVVRHRIDRRVQPAQQPVFLPGGQTQEGECSKQNQGKVKPPRDLIG